MSHLVFPGRKLAVVEEEPYVDKFHPPAKRSEVSQKYLTRRFVRRVFFCTKYDIQHMIYGSNVEVLDLQSVVTDEVSAFFHIAAH